MAMAFEKSSLFNISFLFKNFFFLPLFRMLLSFAQYLKRLYRQRQSLALSVPPLFPGWVSKAGSGDLPAEDRS